MISIPLLIIVLNLHIFTCSIFMLVNDNFSRSSLEQTFSKLLPFQVLCVLHNSLAAVTLAFWSTPTQNLETNNNDSNVSVQFDCFTSFSFVSLTSTACGQWFHLSSLLVSASLWFNLWWGLPLSSLQYHRDISSITTFSFTLFLITVKKNHLFMCTLLNGSL